MVQHTDSTAALQIAEERSLHGFGQSSDMIKFAPHAQLTANTDNWGDYYVQEVKKVLDGSWKSADTWGGMAQNMVVLAPFTNMPDDVKKEALKELGRLSRMSPMAADYGVTRNYVEWLAVLPWAKTSGGEVDIPKAKEILDTDHYDLQKVKDRILDYLSVRRLKPTMKARELRITVRLRPAFGRLSSSTPTPEIVET